MRPVARSALQRPARAVRLVALMSELSDKDFQQQVLGLTRGCEGVYTHEELVQRLKDASSSGKPMRIKLGLDPTAPDIHLGHTVVLGKVRQFQDLGHKAVIVIGDYTARIGDPSGVNKTRPILSPEEIETNATTYIAQAGAVIDTSTEKLEIRRNSEWLGKMNLGDVLELASKKTVAQMLQRDSFKKRLAADEDVFLQEFLYPVMQAYDSVVIEADVELGGNDQTFNNLVGRDIQRAYGQRPQIVMIMPILVGIDGVEKMSKSKGNYIGVTDGPDDMFGKVMSIPDDLMENYFTLLTDIPAGKVAELTDPDTTHPRQAKASLGKWIVSRFHDESVAAAAAAEFDRVFSQRSAPTDMPEIELSASTMNIVALVMAARFAKSKSQAKRLVQQNAVSLDGDKIADIDAEISLTDGAVLKVGKRRFVRIVLR